MLSLFRRKDQGRSESVRPIIDERVLHEATKAIDSYGKSLEQSAALFNKRRKQVEMELKRGTRITKHEISL